METWIIRALGSPSSSIQLRKFDFNTLSGGFIRATSRGRGHNKRHLGVSLELRHRVEAIKNNRGITTDWERSYNIFMVLKFDKTL